MNPTIFFDTIGLLLAAFLALQVIENRRVLKQIKESMHTYAISNKELNELANGFAWFKAAFDYALDAVLIADPDGKVLYCNKAFEKITGFAHDEIIGSKAGTMWGKLMPIEFYDHLWKIVKTDKQPLSTNLTNHRKNGEHYAARVNIVPILNEAKTDVKYFVAVEHEEPM